MYHLTQPACERTKQELLTLSSSSSDYYLSSHSSAYNSTQQQCESVTKNNSNNDRDEDILDQFQQQQEQVQSILLELSLLAASTSSSQREDCTSVDSVQHNRLLDTSSHHLLHTSSSSDSNSEECDSCHSFSISDTSSVNLLDDAENTQHQHQQLQLQLDCVSSVSSSDSSHIFFNLPSHSLDAELDNLDRLVEATAEISTSNVTENSSARSVVPFDTKGVEPFSDVEFSFLEGDYFYNSSDLASIVSDTVASESDDCITHESASISEAESGDLTLPIRNTTKRVSERTEETYTLAIDNSIVTEYQPFKPTFTESPTSVIPVYIISILSGLLTCSPSNSNKHTYAKHLPLFNTFGDSDDEYDGSNNDSLEDILADIDSVNCNMEWTAEVTSTSSTSTANSDKSNIPSHYNNSNNAAYRMDNGENRVHYTADDATPEDAPNNTTSTTIFTPLARAWHTKREQWRNENYNNHNNMTMNDESTIASRSIAMSDATPIMSNVQRRADGRKNIPSSNATRSGLSTISATPLAEEMSTSSQPEAASPDDNDAHNEPCFTCQTRKGRLIYAVIFIFLLAIIAIIASVLLSLNGGDGGNEGDSSRISDTTPTLDTGTLPPADELFPTFAPSLRGTIDTVVIDNTQEDDVEPTAAPTRARPRPQVPVIAKEDEDEEPRGGDGVTDAALEVTQSPTTITPTVTPTSAPTISWSSTRFDLGQQILGLEEGSEFGSALSLSRDGQVLTIGAPADISTDGVARAGKVYIYNQFGGSWQLQQVIEGRNEQDNLGSSVALSSDGSTIAISEPNWNGRTGNVRVYRLNGSTYELAGSEINGSGTASYFGLSVALSGDGNRLVVGAPFASGVDNFRVHGQVQVFEYNGSDWVFLGEPLSGTGNLDWLGSAVDISQDGSVIAASAPRSPRQAGYVRLWEWNTSTLTWDQVGNSVIGNVIEPAQSDNRFGDSISLWKGERVLRVAIGAPWKELNGSNNSGMAFVYQLQRQTNDWIRLGRPIVPNSPSAGDEAGTSVHLEEDLLAVGIPGASNGSGRVQVYRYVDQEWKSLSSAIGRFDTNSNFGIAVSMRLTDSGDVEVVAGGNGNGEGFVGTYTEREE